MGAGDKMGDFDPPRSLGGLGYHSRPMRAVEDVCRVVLGGEA